MAERVLAGEEALGEGLIDDNDAWGLMCVGIGEVAAGEDGDAECMEEVGTDAVFALRALFAVGVGRFVSIDLRGAVVVGPARAGSISGEADGFDAG
jgi:hypothetical protein